MKDRDMSDFDFGCRSPINLSLCFSTKLGDIILYIDL
jgi:hypothetical protein